MNGGGAALLDRVLVGDVETLDRVVAVAWPRLGGSAPIGAFDRADLRQEALGAAVEAARAYQAARDGDPLLYLRDRVRRRIDALLQAERRRRSRVVPLVDVAAPNSIDTASDDLAGEIGDPRLARALGRLSPRLRAVIARIYWREQSAAEIAAAEGLDPSTVRQMRRRAEAALRRDLTDDQSTSRRRPIRGRR